MTQLYVCHHSSIKICHDALIGVPCLNPMCAMTHSYESTWNFSPWSDSLVSISPQLNYMCAITRIHMPWLMYIRNGTHTTYISWHTYNMCAMTRIHKKKKTPTHNSYTYAMTHSRVCHASVVCAPWHIYICHIYICVTCVPCLSCMWAMTDLYMSYVNLWLLARERLSRQHFRDTHPQLGYDCQERAKFEQLSLCDTQIQPHHHTHTRTTIPYTHTNTPHTYTHTHTHMYMWIRICVRINKYIYTYIYIHICKYVCEVQTARATSRYVSIFCM